MMLIEDTPIPDATLPVEAFKAHLRLGSGFAPGDVQDAVLVAFLRAAVVAVEGRTAKVLLRRAFAVRIAEWRSCDSYVLPVAPVTAVSAVETIDRFGAQAPVAATLWRLEPDGHAPKLRPTGLALPSIPPAGAVVVAFEAGFSADWDGVPADLQQAVMMLAAHYYEYRNDTGLSEGCMPFGVSSLIERYRPVRLGAAR